MSTYDDVWRVDDKMAAPEEWTTPENPHWWAENILERVARALADLRDATYTKPGPFDAEDEENLVWFTRMGYRHARQGRDYARNALQTVQTLQTDMASVSSKLDDLIAGQSANSAKLDQIATLLDQHASGTLDAQDVVDGIRQLLHDATAPAS